VFVGPVVIWLLVGTSNDMGRRKPDLSSLSLSTPERFLLTLPLQPGSSATLPPLTWTGDIPSTSCSHSSAAGIRLSVTMLKGWPHGRLAPENLRSP
jgi:hypothetical protein